MKQIMILSFFLIASAVSAQDNDLAVIELEIHNIANEKGQMLIGLYDSEGSWLKNAANGMFGEIVDGMSKVTFTNISDGTYAISVFHDADNDGKLDMFLGIPTEDTGSSNDAPANFGPPKWEDAKFVVKKGIVNQIINL